MDIPSAAPDDAPKIDLDQTELFTELVLRIADLEAACIVQRRHLANLIAHHERREVDDVKAQLRAEYEEQFRDRVYDLFRAVGFNDAQIARLQQFAESEPHSLTEQMVERMARLQTLVEDPNGRLTPRAREVLVKHEVEGILKHLDEEDEASRKEVLNQLSEWGLTPQ